VKRKQLVTKTLSIVMCAALAATSSNAPSMLVQARAGQVTASEAEEQSAEAQNGSEQGGTESGLQDETEAGNNADGTQQSGETQETAAGQQTENAGQEEQSADVAGAAKEQSADSTGNIGETQTATDGVDADSTEKQDGVDDGLAGESGSEEIEAQQWVDDESTAVTELIEDENLRQALLDIYNDQIKKAATAETDDSAESGDAAENEDSEKDKDATEMEASTEAGDTAATITMEEFKMGHLRQIKEVDLSDSEKYGTITQAKGLHYVNGATKIDLSGTGITEIGIGEFSGDTSLQTIVFP
jgi:hypothetical protein